MTFSIEGANATNSATPASRRQTAGTADVQSRAMARGRRRTVVLVSATLLAGCGRPRDAGSGPDFVLAALHSDAAGQPTARGRILATLSPFAGRLYVGYGDIDANTGPIVVAAFDPARAGFAREWTSDTEAVYTYRAFGGRLVAPGIDPRAAADYAIGPPWRDLRPVGADHVYDVATLDGRELWLAGSQGLDATLWRVDERGRGREALRVAPEDRGGDDFARFYFVFTLQGRLYVQARDFHAGPKAAAQVWDGSGWSPGPNLLPAPDAQGWHPQPFGERVVYLGRQTVHPQGSPLFVFDGVGVAQPLGALVHDVAIAEGRLAALATDGRILITTDLSNWTQAARAPAGSRSLGALGRDLYVGTEQGALYRSKRPLP
jgi:hypothetical protein